MTPDLPTTFNPASLSSAPIVTPPTNPQPSSLKSSLPTSRPSPSVHEDEPTPDPRDPTYYSSLRAQARVQKKLGAVESTLIKHHEPETPMVDPLAKNKLTDRPTAKTDAPKKPKDVYEKFFGKSFGTGAYTTLKSYGGGLLSSKRTVGLISAMKTFKRKAPSSGKNLSKTDINLIGGRIGKTLEHLPTWKSYDGREQGISSRQQRAIVRDLQKARKEGKITSTDIIDAKKIIKNIKI